MLRSTSMVGFCVCVAGAALALLVPLESINRLWYQRDDTPLVLPTSQLPRKEAVIALLREQSYDELTKIYGLTLAADQRSATDALDRFGAFAYADPGLQEFLDGWTATHESSALPFIARGQYYLHLAHTVRGDRFRSETSPDQFSEMQRLLKLAGMDFRRATEIGSPSVAAYEGLIDIAITDGERREAKAMLDRALAATDNPLPLHYAFMRALKPQWGGSHGAILDYWEGLRRSGTMRHSDQYLDFIGIVLKAEEACSINDCEGAVARYDEALSLWPERKGMLQHARALAALERYDEALDVLDAALRRDPDLSGHLALKAVILGASERREDAIVAIQEALKLDPYDPDLLMASKTLSDELEREKQQTGNEAAAAFYRQKSYSNVEKALVYGAGRGDVQVAWARAILSNDGAREEAYAAFEEATRLTPDEPDYVLAYAGALAYAKDCKALQLYRRFEKMCTRGGYCGKYISIDIFNSSMEEHCKNPEQARRERMLPSTLEELETCKADYKEVPAEHALSRCTERAKAGDAAAAFDLGVIYGAGYGVDIDHASAVQWLEVAAGHGHLKAKTALGSFVYQGLGTEKNAERGLRMTREAAEEGYVAAMIALGFLYYAGSNDDRNVQESKRWFMQAAELGSPEARSALNRLFGEEHVGR